MREALALARRGRGRTAPNPVVGACVIGPDGMLVGRGITAPAGGRHAEVQALDEAGDRARGATLYCTLEPCAHVGRTGPCTARIIAAGIGRVVVAMGDPFPLVRGRGLAALRDHGIEVTVGDGFAEAVQLNRPYLRAIAARRPFVVLKAATSLDGRIAAREGVRTRLTSSAANLHVHLDRAQIDGIAVGSKTVLVDDPLLTARGVRCERPLARVVFDRRGMLLAANARLLLLDEPTAGMTQAETAATADLIRILTGSTTVLVIEHDIGFIEALGCPVTVMAKGRILCSGDFAEIRADARVRELYFGRAA
jgi:diaminohydroxyphosphoribosylaminopyrimidine deaminase/5-amino-6-(5-phosphoribosylamino)uracil reductase